MRSNASNQLEVFVQPQSTPVPLPQKGFREDQQNQTKLSLIKKKKEKVKLTEIGAMWKCENLLLYGKKRRFFTIQTMKNIIIRMENRKHGNG